MKFSIVVFVILFTISLAIKKYQSLLIISKLRTHSKLKSRQEREFDLPPPADDEYDDSAHEAFNKELHETQEFMSNTPKTDLVMDPEEPNEDMEAHENEQALGISEVETNQYEQDNVLDDNESSSNELDNPAETTERTSYGGASGMNGMEKQYINEIYHISNSA